MEDKPKNPFEKLTEKLQHEPESSAQTARKDRPSGTQIFDDAAQKLEEKTEIRRRNLIEEAEKKVCWNRPYDTYGRKLRKQGHGFETADVLSYFIKLDGLIEDSKSRNFKENFSECIERNIQDCQNEKVLEERCSQGLMTPAEKSVELEQIEEKRQAFLHLTAMAWLGLRLAGYNTRKDNPALSEGERRTRLTEYNKTYETAIELAKAAFYKRNKALNREALEEMCKENGPAYDIFVVTIDELTGLFGKHFTGLSEDTRLSYLKKLQSATMQTTLSHLEYLLDMPHLASAISARNRLEHEIRTAGANLQKTPTSVD